MIVIHPAWCARAGIGDIVRHFTIRGYDVSNETGSRFFTVTEKPTLTREPNNGRVVWTAPGFRLANLFRDPCR